MQCFLVIDIENPDWADEGTRILFASSLEALLEILRDETPNPVDDVFIIHVLPNNISEQLLAAL
jgi:hypothetical protein